MWGFVSITLALLFIFLPATTHTHRSMPVDRPHAYHSTSMPRALREDAMQITVSRDGQIYFRDDRVILQDLPEEIRQGLRNGAENRIYLNVDAREKYGETIAVLHQIRQAGIEKAIFLTEQLSR